MSKQKIILLIILALSVIALSVWSFYIFKNRYADDSNLPSENTSSNENPTPNLPDNDEPIVIDDNVDTDIVDSVLETPAFISITREDCLNGCKRFPKGPELTYCQQSCGLATPQDNPGDCADKTGLDKDYCFKDATISAKDFNICEKISDKGIKKSCVTRITEEVLQEQFQNSPPLPE